MPSPHPATSFLRLDTRFLSAKGLWLWKEGEKGTEVPRAIKPPGVPQAAFGISEFKSGNTDSTGLLLWNILASWDRDSKLGGGGGGESQTKRVISFRTLSAFIVDLSA